MYDKFQKELYNRETIQTDKGYILFEVYDDKSAYIHQLYVEPEYRKEGYGHTLEMMIVEKYDVNRLACYVDCSSNNPEQSLLAILNVGYKIYNMDKNTIQFYKDIK